MSYSFGVRAPSKQEALTKVEEQLDKVLASQPIDVSSTARAGALAADMIGALPDSETRDVVATVSGSVSWSKAPNDEPPIITGISVSVHAHLADRV